MPILSGLLFSTPLWTVISWLLGWADLPGAHVALALAYVCIGIPVFFVALAFRKETRHAR